MRAPLMASNTASTRSLPRKANIMGVMAPASSPKVPTNSKWLAMRFSSHRITRTYSARSGTSRPISFSTARQKTSSLLKLEM